jgi:hypothetical protein
LAFEVGAAIGKDGGEEFARRVMEQTEGRSLNQVEMVDRMRELGFPSGVALEWLFSVNGYRRGNKEDEEVVGRIVGAVYE